MKKMLALCVLLLALTVGTGTSQAQVAPAAFNPAVQSPGLFYDEARTVYLGNLTRRSYGLAPQRWNRELTLAARWFSWDSVEQRSSPYCGHTDTTGGAPWDRAATWGYLGFAGAENAFCGYVTPEDAIAGWMNSPGHRDNLLNSTFREIGLGYYRRPSDGRGYVTQLFGVDDVYPPLIIENEKPETSTAQVRLYQYSPSGAGGMTSMGAANQMMISNNACFSGASWQSYQLEPQWTLSSGQGWKTVHTKISDRLGRTSTASDSIYYGASLPTAEQTMDLLSRTRSSVMLYGLDSGGLPSMQFSPGWIADDSHPNFTMYGNPMPHTPATPDNNAIGGTVYRMAPGGNTWAWVWTYNEFPSNFDYVAYFRLKTNSRPAEPVITITAENQSRTIYGSNFSAAGQYQEFALPFHYTSTSDDPFMIFQVSLNGSATVDVDAVTIFTQSLPAAQTYNWRIPGGHYRGQGIWVRFTNDNGAFSGYQEAVTTPPLLTNASQVYMMAEPYQPSRVGTLRVSLPCGGNWWVVSKPDWMNATPSGSTLMISGSAASSQTGSLVLQTGSYQVSIPANLWVVEQIRGTHLPVIRR